MRQGQQHRRGRGRNNNNNNHSHSHNHNQHHNHRKGQNPLTRSFESNGPEVKVRGTPAHIAEKYISLARDAHSSGDPVLAESYLQHAEHYNRIILTYREQQGLQSGEANGNGQLPHQQRMRSDGTDGDGGGDDEAGDDPSQVDQPTITRFPQDAQPAQRGPDQPRLDDRQPRNEGQGEQQQGRFRDRHEQRPRFDRGDRYDRHGRGDRGERGDRGDRGERLDRGDRVDRGERFERSDRPERGERFERNDRPERGDRPDRGERFERGDRGDRGERSERGFVDRGPERDRPQQAERAPLERAPLERVPDERVAEPRAPIETSPEPEFRVREPREHREPREPRAPRQRPPEDAGAPAVVPAAPASRAENGPRRRERFVAEGDQPEFLRRPVRRPRREPDSAVPEAPAATPDEPTRD